MTKENVWVVACDYDNFRHLFKYNKEFKDVEKAVKYVYKIYEKELKNEIKKSIDKLRELLKSRKESK